MRNRASRERAGGHREIKLVACWCFDGEAKDRELEKRSSRFNKLGSIRLGCILYRVL